MGAPQRRRGRPPQHVVVAATPEDYEATYRGSNWLQVRSRVRARDKTCRHRGRGPCRGPLQVNHKVPYRCFAHFAEANQLSNLELLCEKHHREVDRDVWTVDWHPAAICVRRPPAPVANDDAPAVPAPSGRHHGAVDHVMPEEFRAFLQSLASPPPPPRKPVGFVEHLVNALVLYALAGGLLHLAGFLG